MIHRPPGLLAFNQDHWSQFAGSGVWLPHLLVYLVVSRVAFTRPSTSGPTISFLRAQVFDAAWKHMDGYVISWEGRKIQFPTILDIPALWREGGSYFGPEDPRTILDPAADTEPIIVFNMIMNETGNPRVMWIHRPFSGVTVPLTIQGEQREKAEKNWAPFFHESTGDGGTSKIAHVYLHFVYSLSPLRVLKCRIEDGICDWVYKQHISGDLDVPHMDPHGEMHGGTNFVPVPFSRTSEVQVYAGFPRTRLTFCKTGATYRPELVLLTGSGEHFHVAFASGPLGFEHSLLSQQQIDHTCEDGRLLIPSGLMAWDYPQQEDVTTLFFSVSDAETRVLHLHGLLDFIRGLPYFRLFDGSVPIETFTRNFPWSVVGNEVLHCSLDAAANSNRMDLIKSEGKAKTMVANEHGISQLQP
ncbi:Beta-mannosyltransferase 1 [Aspergillus melleus]|uniref:Beta-mannosyltransferase 1 n=1 Tax=Aspergillus melleus TaxID=138277 RepID=UPI001E8EA3FF|nr:Beta-mannosyltransferase 1 [Aspergillus melleus]KAH8435409.1 Beta-mannosyltransferase 1 [Aspergillus melleus]